MADSYFRQTALAPLGLAAKATDAPGEAGVLLSERPLAGQVNLRGDGGSVEFLQVVRTTLGHLPRRSLAAAALVAVIVVAANFFLLYTYVGALINPDVSAGIVLVFTLLLWVNICVRAYLGALCWVGSTH